LSSKPQQGASAALDEPFGLTATAAGEAAAKLKSRQGVRLPNASESQILRELALASLVDVKNPIEDFQIRVFSGATKVRGFGETVGKGNSDPRTIAKCTIRHLSATKPTF
jgi:hypothetical protein